MDPEVRMDSPIRAIVKLIFFFLFFFFNLQPILRIKLMLTVIRAFFTLGWTTVTRFQWTLKGFLSGSNGPKCCSKAFHWNAEAGTHFPHFSFPSLATQRH